MASAEHSLNLLGGVYPHSRILIRSYELITMELSLKCVRKNQREKAAIRIHIFASGAPGSWNTKLMKLTGSNAKFRSPELDFETACPGIAPLGPFHGLIMSMTNKFASTTSGVISTDSTAWRVSINGFIYIFNENPTTYCGTCEPSIPYNIVYKN